GRSPTKMRGAGRPCSAPPSSSPRGSRQTGSPCTAARPRQRYRPCTSSCRRKGAPSGSCGRNWRRASPKRRAAGASPICERCPSGSLPGPLAGGRGFGDYERVGARRRWAHPLQGDGLLEVAAGQDELIAAQRHAVHLPHAVPQRDPQAVPDHTPTGDLIAELRRAVAAHHDVPELVAGAGQPIALEPAVVGRLRRGPGRGDQREQRDETEAGHGGRKYTSISYPGAVGPGPATGRAARSSVSTATCASNRRIIAVNAWTSSGSNSRPASSSR